MESFSQVKIESHQHIYKNRSMLGAASFWGKDSKPQDRCLAYGELNKFSCYMCTEEKGRTYYCYRNYKHFETHFKTKNCRNWFELIRPDLPTKLFFDYDEKTPEDPGKSYSEEIISKINKVLDTHVPDYDPELMIVLDGSRQCGSFWKVSFHFIYNSLWCFDSMNSHKLFFDKMHSKENFDKDPILKNFDKAIYTRNRVFRTLFSKKKGNTTVLLPFYDSIGRTPQMKFEFLDSMVQYFPFLKSHSEACLRNDLIQHTELPSHELPSDPSIKPVQKQPDLMTFGNLPQTQSDKLDVSEIIGLFYEYQQKAWSEIRYEFRDLRYPFLNFNTLVRKPCFSSTCGRMHENDHTAVIKINADGSAFLFCRKNVSERIYIKTANATPSSERMGIPAEIDPRSPILKDQNDVSYCSRYVKDIDLDKNYFIKSQLGTGKTYAFTNLIIKLLKRNPNSKILILSQRIQYAREIHAKVNKKLIEEKICTAEDPFFEIYKDHRSKSISNVKKGYVMGVHSLDKFQNDDMFIWDLVIGDEIRSIFCEFCTRELMGKRYQANAVKLEKLFKQAKNFVVCDAFATQSDVTKMNFFRTDYQLIVNTWKPTEKRYMIRMPDFDDMIFKIQEKLRQGEKCVLHSTSKKKVLESGLLEWADRNRVKYKYYSQESDDNDKNSDFKNIQDAWKVDLLIYTPTITVGVSFDQVHFDNLFVYFSTYSSMIRDTFQSMYRVRNFKNKIIHYSILDRKNHTVDIPLTRPFIERQFKISQAADKDLYAKYGFVIQWIDGEFGWISESLYNYFHEKAWHHSQINNLLLAYMDHCNIVSENNSSLFFFEKKEKKSEILTYLEKYSYSNIESLTHEAYWAKFAKLQDNVATVEDKLEILKFEFQDNFQQQMFHIIRTTPYEEYSDQLPGCFENWLDNPKHIEHVRLEKEEDIRICMNEDLPGSKGFIQQVPKETRQLEVIKDIFSILGIDSTYNKNTFSEADFQKLEENDIFQRIAKCFNIRVRTKNEKLKMKQVLNQCLADWAGTKLTAKRNRSMRKGVKNDNYSYDLSNPWEFFYNYLKPKYYQKDKLQPLNLEQVSN